MKTTLMWTLNDFLAYRMVFGWSIYGKLTCLYCMKNNKAFTLTNGGKAFYLFIYCHWNFLPSHNSYRNNKNFLKGKTERDVASLTLSSEELYDVNSQHEDIIFGFQSGKNFSSFGVNYNWVKQSIF